MRVNLKGIHAVRKKLAGGREVIYHYAWRGGPRIIPVAPSPAASIGDATISSVGHRPSSIVAPNPNNNFAKSKTPAPASVAAPHRRLEQVDRCYCRRSPSRAREDND